VQIDIENASNVDTGRDMSTRYLAIYEDDEKKVFIEYQPAHYSMPAPANAIEILSVDIQYKRPSTWQEQRAEYQSTPIKRPAGPRQMDLFEC
jgi:hypothetical protein